MKFTIITLLAIIASTLAVPVSETENKPVKPDTKLKDKLRQGDEEDGVGEVEQVGEQVSQIISGLFSGNFGQIFKGSTGFIEDQDTETGVDTILTSVALPLNTILTQGVQQGQKYYNITTPAPPTIVPPSQKPSSTVVVNPLPIQNTQPQVLEPIVVQQLPVETTKFVAVPAPAVVTAAPLPQVVPVVVPSKPGDEEDEDAENESDATLRKQ
ncbi:uncharacterized protein LOC110844363 [Folsomia candida]|uniref:Uncharacterized protein n=1 Tax=Folsomia candida TaxID=158441 RepID=A0A226EU59_FOLCA|nr:uncharacterized protein LOC110844363 [Folsomia candida]OXA60156.1 hypothetical protein Fcan01_05824 [Folsomia candida]